MAGAMKGLALALVLATAAGAAQAGWYEVRNYTGTIGQAAVHLSLQTFDARDQAKPEERLVEGSYYYDAHRIAIPLKGRRQADGRMVLCEAVEPRNAPAGALEVPKPSPRHPAPCPIALLPAQDGLAGEWKDGARTLPVSLRQVARLDDRGEAPVIEGSVEIPMWVRTRNQLVLGVYRSAKDCPLSMRELRLVDSRSGKVDRSIPLRCDAGLIMTSIYANVSAASNANELMVGYQGGMMGTEEPVDIWPRAARKAAVR